MNFVMTAIQMGHQNAIHHVQEMSLVGSVLEEALQLLQFVLQLVGTGLSLALKHVMTAFWITKDAN